MKKTLHKKLKKVISGIAIVAVVFTAVYSVTRAQSAPIVGVTTSAAYLSSVTQANDGSITLVANTQSSSVNASDYLMTVSGTGGFTTTFPGTAIGSTIKYLIPSGSLPASKAYFAFLDDASRVHSYAAAFINLNASGTMTNTPTMPSGSRYIQSVTPESNGDLSVSIPTFSSSDTAANYSIQLIPSAGGTPVTITQGSVANSVITYTIPAADLSAGSYVINLMDPAQSFMYATTTYVNSSSVVSGVNANPIFGSNIPVVACVASTSSCTFNENFKADSNGTISEPLLLFPKGDKDSGGTEEISIPYQYQVTAVKNHSYLATATISFSDLKAKMDTMTSTNREYYVGFGNDYDATTVSPLKYYDFGSVIAAPVTNAVSACGSDNAQSDSALSSTDVDLCAAGSTPTGFNITSTGWSWSCHNSSSPDAECSATDSSIGAAVSLITFTPTSVLAPATTATIKGTLGLSQASTVTSNIDIWLAPSGGQLAKIKSIYASDITQTPVPVTVSLPNLTANTTYDYRIVASSGNDDLYDNSFTTGVSTDQAAGGGNSNGTDAICGTAVNSPQATIPTGAAQLCTSGDIDGSVSGTGPWTWTCKSSDGGLPASCTAQSLASGAAGNGPLCGAATGTTVSTAPSSDADLCSSNGSLLGTVTTTSSGWSWKCSDGGTTINTCTAISTTGAGNTADTSTCGTADTQTLTAAPSGDGVVCAPGSTLNGTVTTTSDGWTWNCDNPNDAQSQDCSASNSTSGAGGGSPSNPANFLQNPFKNLDTFPKIITAVVNNIVLPIAVPFIALMLIYSGMLFVIARKSGDTSGLAKAKSSLVYTLIGAVLVLGCFVIANALQGTLNSIVSDHYQDPKNETRV